MAKPNLDDVTEREFTFVLQEFGLRRSVGLIKELEKRQAEIEIKNSEGEMWKSGGDILGLIGLLSEKNVEYKVTIRGTEEAYEFCKKAIKDYTKPWE